MTQQQIINTGTNPNDATGDPLQTAFNKINANFTALFAGLVAALNTPQSFTATANQTVFNLSAPTVTANILVVSLDGAVLFPTTDYILNASPPTLTLNNGALAGQVLFVR